MADEQFTHSGRELRILRLLRLIGDNLPNYDLASLEAGLQRIAGEGGINSQALAYEPREFLYLVLSHDDLEQPLSQAAQLSVRTRNLLARRIILTVEDLLEHSQTELLRQTGFGHDALDEVLAFLADWGWHLSPHDEQLPKPPPGDEWVLMSAGTEHERYVLRSRLPRAAIHDLEAQPYPDYRILRHLQEKLRILRVGQLISAGRHTLLAANWDDIRPTLSYIGESDASPAHYATERLEELLRLYGLSLPD